jgi:hypothetical protein
MTATIANLRMTKAPNAGGAYERSLYMTSAPLIRKIRPKRKNAWGLAQPIEKAHFGQGNPRKSKLYSWKNLAESGVGLAGF